MKTTAGIFLIDLSNRVLIGHPTNHPETFWSIPKGEFDYPSNPFLEALRELQEETNVSIDINSKYHVIEPRVYKSGKKTLYSFLVLESENANISKNELKCNSFFEYRGKMTPEFDKIEWVDILQAIELVHESQKDQLRSIYSSLQSWEYQH
jgi:predicted NUDIX family NTP pyrophosphohydrolase